MAARRARKKIQRGTVDRLESGAVRVRVDAGIDPITKRRHRRMEIIPADTPDQEAVVEKTRVRLINEINERRHPKTRATVNQLLDRYIRDFDGARVTRDGYESLRRNHIAPFIGHLPVGEVDADVLDSLYVEFRRCNQHCSRSFTEHRTDRSHDCDDRCKPHVCAPLGVSRIRQVHWMLSGAFKSAKRWGWISENPIADAVPPAAPPPKPQPPTAEDAARVVNDAATRDLDWASLVWLTMTTGIRRHELCALRWTDVVRDGDYTILWIRRGVSKDDDGTLAERDTKTHQQRRVTLDPETADVLREHRERCESALDNAGGALDADAFLFSPAVDYRRFYAPDSITQRYDRRVSRLGISTTFHKLRHYSATELIKAGVDINTVAGRLGHAGGGTTTLKVYTAFVSEADQQAAGKLATRMPERSWQDLSDPVERAKSHPQQPYEVVAAALRRQIIDGQLEAGKALPSLKCLASEHRVSDSTAHRAVELLRTWGLAAGGGRGHRTTVVPPADGEAGTSTEPPPGDSGHVPAAQRPVRLRLLRLREEVRSFTSKVDPDDADQLQRLLVAAARRYEGATPQIDDYELEVRDHQSNELLTTVVALQ